MLNKTVFVRKINNLSDARFCAGMMVDFISFDSEKISIEETNEIINWLQGIKVVLEDDNPGDIKHDYILDSKIIKDGKGDIIADTTKFLDANLVGSEEFKNSNHSGLIHHCRNLEELDHLAEILEELDID